jgi:hypothetical protein
MTLQAQLVPEWRQAEVRQVVRFGARLRAADSRAAHSSASRPAVGPLEVRSAVRLRAAGSLGVRWAVHSEADQMVAANWAVHSEAVQMAAANWAVRSVAGL